MTWQKYAACRDHDPETWFPLSEVDPRVTAAKRVCAGCPVRRACLEHAQPFGIWGGFTEGERRAVRRARQRAAATATADPAPPGQPARVA